MIVKYYATIITGFVETLLFGGIIYGWSAINYVFTREGYFSSSCNMSFNRSVTAENVLGCPNQQYNLELVFTLSVSLSFGLSIANGLILDYFGIWVLRTLSSVLLIFSCLTVAFSSPAISWVLYPSIILIGVSGVGLYLTNIETANLLPRRRGVVVNFINGAVVAGIVVFTVAKTAYQHGATVKQIFLFLSVLAFFTILRTYFLMPKILVPHEIPEGYNYGIQECCNQKNFVSESEMQQLVESSGGVEDEISGKSEQNTETLKSFVSTSIYILGVFSFSIQELRINFLVESMNAWLGILSKDNTFLTSSFLSAFGYIQISALIFSPVTGALFDFVFSYFNEKSNLSSKQATLKALSLNCFICSLSTIIYSVLTLIPIANLQYVTFMLAVLSNLLVTANLSLLVIQCFPMEHIGTLFGIAVLICAIVSTLQYPLYYVAVHYFENNFTFVNIIVLLLALLTLAHPANLYRRSKLSN